MSLPLPEDSDLLLRREEAAHVLGYRNERTLIRHEKLGTAPPRIRIGGRVCYRSRTLRQFVLGLERAGSAA